MKFSVRQKSGGTRFGVLSIENHEIQTPCCSLYSRGGVVPHLTTDVLDSMGSVPSIFHLSLQTTIDQPGIETINQSNYNGIKPFLGLEGFITYLSIQDPGQEVRQGYNEEKSVSVWTPGGRKKVDVNQFKAVLESFKPNMAECLCDTIPASGQTEKRIRKSVDRTLKFLDQCIKEREKTKSLISCNLLGVIEGSSSETQRIRSAKETSQRPVPGFVLEGFNTSVCNWCSLLQKTLEFLPDDKPRLVHGIGSPEEVVLAVECGVDIFDSSYPCQVAERGCALDIKWSRKRFKPELTYLPSASERLEGELKNSEDSLNELSTSSHQKEIVGGGTLFEINLNHTRYSSDFTSLVSGCTCYCCTNHTRAYVHHLLVTKEMLSKVLLMIHNLHEYCQFFAGIRLSIEEDNFEEFKRNFTESHHL